MMRDRANMDDHGCAAKSIRRNGFGPVSALVPVLADLRALQKEEISLEEYKSRYLRDSLKVSKS